MAFTWSTNQLRSAIAESQGEQNKRADYFFDTGVEVDALIKSIKSALYKWGPRTRWHQARDLPMREIAKMAINDAPCECR